MTDIMIPDVMVMTETGMSMKLHRRMKYVYIAGPYSKGDVVINVRNAVLAADLLLKSGFVPYVPHLSHLWHTISPHPADFWYDYDLEWLRKCDCLVRLDGESAGADAEVAFARKHGIPVYYSVLEVLEG